MSIAVVIPTWGRSHLLGSLIENIRATADPTVLFVVDGEDHDSKRVITDAGAVFTVHTGTYPQKINAGVRATDEPYVALVNDDVRFHEGWYEAAERAFEKGALVVGPDDLSPATQDGNNATMPIVARSYIEDPGAAWGEKGTALHEGYFHNWSETELWTLACDRRVAQHVRRCVIEHCHPDWGKGEMDATYKRGSRKAFHTDAALFERRMAAWRA